MEQNEVESMSAAERRDMFCSFAVTGAVTSFQPIFICRTCFNENESAKDGDRVPLCVCQACADCCHDGDEHDVEYIGMGPSYCDCDHVGNCQIFQRSLIEAERLGATRLQEQPSSIQTTHEENHCSNVLQEVYTIPSLKDPEDVQQYVDQIQKLIEHSKETFWLDEDCVSKGSLCALEKLAWNIYQHHCQKYSHLLNSSSNGGGGAEWWVQVKWNKPGAEGKQVAIDLHYDKDEALAESFGLGSFPELSTVTYLTPSIYASPTIVLDHRYNQGDDELIESMLVSHPRLGKHLVFDGSLLHGAPSHADLRRPLPLDERTKEPQFRVTFLVNVWKEQKPANVQPLDEEIRSAILTLEEPSASLATATTTTTVDLPLEMISESIEEVQLSSEEELSEDVRHRIELPFVAKGVTWDDQLTFGASRNRETDDGDGDSDDDDDEDGLVVTIFPPPPFTGPSSDTMKIQLGSGMQGYLEYPEPDEEAMRPKDQIPESDYQSGYV